MSVIAPLFPFSDCLIVMEASTIQRFQCLSFFLLNSGISLPGFLKKKQSRDRALTAPSTGEGKSTAWYTDNSKQTGKHNSDCEIYLHKLIFSSRFIAKTH